MRGLLMIVAAAVLAGCSTPSIGPLYSGDVVVRDEAFLGTWIDRQHEGRYTVEKGDGRAYAVAYRPTGADSADAPVRLEVVVVELDGARYADVYPASAAREEVSKRYGTLFLPVHNIVRLSIEGDELTVEMLDINWTKQHAGELEVSGARTDALPVLTGGPEALQAMVRKAAADDRAFSDDAIVLTREVAR